MKNICNNTKWIKQESSQQKNSEIEDKAMKNRQDMAQTDIMLGNIKQKLRQKNGRWMIRHTSKRAYRRKIDKMRRDNIKERMTDNSNLKQDEFKTDK